MHFVRHELRGLVVTSRLFLRHFCFTVTHSSYLFYVAPLACSPNFFPFHGGCFLVNTKNSLNWQQALAQCRSEGGTLAKISREGLRYAFSNLLEGMTPKPSNLHFGLMSRDSWVWIDGSLLNGSLWMPGYPTRSDRTQGCAVLSAGSTKLKNVDCRLTLKPLCQKQPGKFQWSIFLNE